MAESGNGACLLTYKIGSPEPSLSLACKILRFLRRDNVQITGIRNSGQIFGMLAFAWVLSDSMINYFIKTLTGTLLPVTSLLPVILAIIIMKWGWRQIIPPMNITIAIGLASISFLAGPLIAPDISSYRIVETIGAVSAFFVGYYSLRWTTNENHFARLFILVCGLYAVVCVIALLHIAPNLFPVVNSRWAFRGTIEMRPEVMTDQNFQIFYLFPILLVLALPYRFWRFWAAFLIALAGLYVIAKVQSRSGMLVYLGTLVLSIMAPLWTRALGRKKIVILPIVVLVLVILNLDWILRAGNLMIVRFTESDYATGYARLISITYLFDHLFNLLWWAPHGYVEFTKIYGNIPHSNATAMFLEGGILGLYMWVVVFMVPLIRLAGMYFKKQLDPLATMVLVGGTSCLVTELSLNVPFFKQPWLWAGAVVGVLYRIRQQRFIAAREKHASRDKVMAKPELTASARKNGRSRVSAT
jgi:hypothetical protein